MAEFIAVIKILPSVIGLIRQVIDLINKMGVAAFIKEVDAVTLSLKEAKTREDRVLAAGRFNDLIVGLRKQL